ncbi:hypothetical protein HUT19_37955 [Streptomyces sp. NA02950]|uniref:hypothetical protein n=1 Tax=Streptomyces sp. NA02950 TaxID=2742137 RepID=UPI00158FC309|nr:hypothetical protein [Streptomyces sp. NA02950]QKV96770.1 hypothetical protein HUT19_37955 [Streptomyces sp. NA02950]
MNISGRARGGVVPRLLLMVVLAMGVVVMHTVGHPDGDSGSGTGGSAHHAAVAPHSAPHHGGHGPHHGDHGDHGDHGGHARSASIEDGSHQAGPLAGEQASAPMAEPREPMAAMDMASLCVAVLGVWVLAGLLYAALTRRRGPPPDASAPRSATVRPCPPSPGPDLVALSVLRI